VRLTAARSPRMVPGGDASAFATAASAGTDTLKPSTGKDRVRDRIRSTSGRAQWSSTAWTAASPERPPMEIPPRTTPSGTPGAGGMTRRDHRGRHRPPMERRGARAGRSKPARQPALQQPTAGESSAAARKGERQGQRGVKRGERAESREREGADEAPARQVVL